MNSPCFEQNVSANSFLLEMQRVGSCCRLMPFSYCRCYLAQTAFTASNSTTTPLQCHKFSLNHYRAHFLRHLHRFCREKRRLGRISCQNTLFKLLYCSAITCSGIYICERGASVALQTVRCMRPLLSPAFLEVYTQRDWRVHGGQRNDLLVKQ